MDDLLTDQTFLIAISLVAVLLIVGAIVFLRFSKSRKRRLQSVIQSISSEALVNVVIPDGMGGEIHLDHLLLTPDGLLLLDLKDMGGTVFAGDKLDEWTVMDSSARLTFRNPIPVLADRVAALKLVAPEVPVTAKVVFTDAVQFPKGHPQQVTTLDELTRERAADSEADLTDIWPYWEQIKAAAKDA